MENLKFPMGNFPWVADGQATLLPIGSTGQLNASFHSGCSMIDCIIIHYGLADKLHVINNKR